MMEVKHLSVTGLPAVDIFMEGFLPPTLLQVVNFFVRRFLEVLITRVYYNDFQCKDQVKKEKWQSRLEGLRGKNVIKLPIVGLKKSLCE